MSTHPDGGLYQAIDWANGENNKTNHYTIVLMDSFPYGGEEIKGNVTITTNSSDPNTLTLVLSEGGAQGFKIADGGNLTICGNGTNQLILEGKSDNTKSLINVTSGGTFTMKVNSTLKGNNIVGDKNAEFGGAVTVNGGTFFMKDGTITGNSVGDRGGGVIVNGGEFVMEGGTITENTATNNGGGVYVNGGTFEMSGGKITKNTATNWHGGGVFLSRAPSMTQTSTFTMSGGEISENSAHGDGSGVGVFGSTFIMKHDAKITNNRNGGVYLTSEGNTMLSRFEVNGGAVIAENTGHNLYIANGQMYLTDAFTGRIGVTHTSQQDKAELIQFATGQSHTITAEDASHFFADDPQNYGVQLREDSLYLVITHVIKAADPPKQSSVWISAPVSNSKLGSGILDNPNGGTVNFPEGFPFKSVTINQAGEVTQTSPSTAEDDFESQYKNNFPSANYYIIASSDITANPDVQTDQKTRLEFTVPIEKILDGYTVGVYHGVVKGQEDPIPVLDLGEIRKEEVAQAAYDAGSKAWEASNEVYELIHECNRGLDNPSFNLEAAYYALQEAIQKANEAIEAAREAAWAAERVGDREATRAAEDAVQGSRIVVNNGEEMMEAIVEKLGYVPQGNAESGDLYTWKSEKVIETGRSDGLVHYAVEVSGLSPFVIVVEQGGAEPAKEYNSDYAPPLDHEPITATPAESPAPMYGLILGLIAAVMGSGVRRR